MKCKIKAGTTSFTLAILVYKTSDGTFFTGLTHASSGLVFEYRRRNQSTWTDVTAVAGTLGSFTSGGFVADGAQAGAYEIGVPNAAITAGADRVYVRLRGVDDMHPVIIEVELDVVDYQTAAFGANTTTPPTAAANALQVRTELTTELARIDAAISTRLDSIGTNAPSSWINAAAIASSAITDDKIASNAITAAKIAASALDNKGNWNVGKTGYALTQSFPANFASMAINASGEITTSNPALGGGSAHTAQDVANLILATPANKLATNASGEVVASNMRGTDGANTTTPPTVTDIWNYLINGIHASQVLLESAQFAEDASNVANSMAGATFDAATDSLEAIRDRGDVAWVTGSGGGGGGGGDPWATSLPGVYGAGTAGSILGNHLDATVSSRAAPSDVSPTINFNPAINPTELSGGSVSAIQSGLALEATLTEIKGATFDAGTDSLEAIRDRGDAAWAAGAISSDQIDDIAAAVAASVSGPTSGDFTITRTFSLSGGGDVVPSVRMSLIGVAGKVATSNDQGVATIKANAGSYTLRFVTPPGYENIADQAITSLSGDVSASVTVVPTPSTTQNNVQLSYSEIRRNVGRLLGFGSDPDTFDASSVLATDDAIRSGLRDFYWPSVNGAPYEWSFLRKLISITLSASSRQYSLPVNFVRLASAITIDGEDYPLRQISESAIRSMSQSNPESGNPVYFAIVPDETAIASGDTAYKLSFYPVPDDSSSVVQFWYAFSPMIDLTAGGPLGGVNYSSAVIECCLARAELAMNLESLNQTGGIHIVRAERSLSMAIESDRNLQAGIPPTSQTLPMQQQG